MLDDDLKRRIVPLQYCHRSPDLRRFQSLLEDALSVLIMKLLVIAYAIFFYFGVV